MRSQRRPRLTRRNRFDRIAVRCVICSARCDPRRQRRKAEKRGEIRPPEADPYEVEQLWRMVDRMEERLAVLERAISDQQPPRLGRDQQDEFEPVEDREAGRTK